MLMCNINVLDSTLVCLDGVLIQRPKAMFNVLDSTRDQLHSVATDKHARWRWKFIRRGLINISSR